MPIFIGLYRALQVEVELRDAPLISSGVRWCSNLAAPDMLFDWSGFMPATVNSGIGFPSFPLLGGLFGLGPYLNLFPMVTIALFLIQQKVMMPPAADEQAATQQKMMKYFMVIMGLMFYKVAAGLCIYFIASTLWGLAEQPLPAQGRGGRWRRGRDRRHPAARQGSAAERVRARGHSPEEEEAVDAWWDKRAKRTQAHRSLVKLRAMSFEP